MVEVDLLRDLDILTLDQYFHPWHMHIPTLILEFLVLPLVSSFRVILHPWSQSSNYAILRDTLPRSVMLFLIRKPNVIYVVEIIIQPDIVSIMTRAQTTLECMPLLLTLHRHLILHNHKISSIPHIELLHHIHHSHLLSFQNNNLLCKQCTQCSILQVHHPILRFISSMAHSFWCHQLYDSKFD
jgi:hypothetical protein